MRDIDEQLKNLRASSLFDSDWYRSQLGPDAERSVIDPVLHYLETGWRNGLSANPAFDDLWYTAQHGAREIHFDGPPLIHYLHSPRPAPSPHPMFDEAEYFAQNRSSAEHPGGPLGHYLAGLGTGPGLPDPSEFKRLAATAYRTVLATGGTAQAPRETKSFDEERANAFKKHTLEAHDGDAPLVSIIVPTLNRERQLPRCIQSVLDQDYSNWELIIVDDGSTDATQEVLQQFTDDPRVRVLANATPQGVARARNMGLRAARGEYVAYLDSDNTWLPDFLSVMIAFIRTQGYRVAYAMSELVKGGTETRVYRGMAFDRRALEEQNYIDCICLIHERAILDETGMFDEELRRNVDWDLLIRFAQVADFGFAPFIATSYDAWDNETGRISTDVPRGYRFRVRQRTLLEWPKAASGKVSLVSIVVTIPPEGCAPADIQRLRAEVGEGPELVLVERHAPRHLSIQLQFAASHFSTRYMRLPQPLTEELARNFGGVAASGDRMVFLPITVWREPDWLEPLVDALDEFSVVQPLLVHDDGSVTCAGLNPPVRSGADPSARFHKFSGTAPEVRRTDAVWATRPLVTAVRRNDFLAIGGFDPLVVNDFACEDFSRRVVQHSGRPAGCVGASVVVEPMEPTPSRQRRMEAAAASRELRTLRGDNTTTSGDDPYRHAGYREIGIAPMGEDASLPILVHDRAPRPRRWALKIGPATVQRRGNWGDWHFALSLRDALERLGQEVSIDCRDAWYRPTGYLDDVVLVIRGVRDYRPRTANLNLLWVISHPHDITPAEVQSYDSVFAASHRWATYMGRRSGQPVDVLLQCTDQHRFYPRPPVLSQAYPVLNVSNARGLRPAVRAALNAGIVPAVYGVRWEGLLPAGALQGTYVPNEDLPVLYSSAGVVLNDHWDDMRDEGFVSNRLFDLAATEARVLSDHMPEIAHIFDGTIATFSNTSEVGPAIQRLTEEDQAAREARQVVGERVRREHTFDARARRLVDHVEAISHQMGR